jgi:hypothetical protein
MKPLTIAAFFSVASLLRSAADYAQSPLLDALVPITSLALIVTAVVWARREGRIA